MKRFWLLLLLLLLTGCASGTNNDTTLLVNLRERENFTVENNGQLLMPGENAVFYLNINEGFALSGTDYAGETTIELTGGKTKVTLENVQYPAHVTVNLTTSYAEIIYHPNGGEGEAVSVYHDTANHARPNTSNGQGLFLREGYTLICWNRKPDGSGERIGLSSRVTVPAGPLDLYAQWAKWSDEADFDWMEAENGITITGYHGADSQVVIPGTIGGIPVTKIDSGAFVACDMREVILSPCLIAVEEGAFQSCALEKLTLYDNIEFISDASFDDCDDLQTLYINAVEKPYGYNYRKESCYADKVDLLIDAQGSKKVVFYGGCSMWYNLDASLLSPLVEQGYGIVNVALNGFANSSVQMQIIGHFLEEGDIFFHTPEIASKAQMMVSTTMDADQGDKLWCGLEYNYDLLALADLRGIDGVLDSLCKYLTMKESGTDYGANYIRDGNCYIDEFGCIPFERTETVSWLSDEVFMNASYISDKSMTRLKSAYNRYQENGVRVYVSYACINMDAVAEEERGNVGMVHERFSRAVMAMEYPVLISDLADYLYTRDDFYDTNYHLLSDTARENTVLWLRDLQTQMRLDGLWEEQ